MAVLVTAIHHTFSMNLDSALDARNGCGHDDNVARPTGAYVGVR